jgi:hypothetical protein
MLEYLCCCIGLVTTEDNNWNNFSPANHPTCFPILLPPTVTAMIPTANSHEHAFFLGEYLGAQMRSNDDTLLMY